MPALASPSTWRQTYTYKRYLYLLPPTAIFKARVNMASATYPLADITYDTVTVGAFADIEIGMTVLLGSTDGGWDLGIQRIRAAADADQIFIGWSSRGARIGEVDLADNAYITVLNDYRVWGKTPRYLDDGTMYKDYDLALGTFGTQPPPIANLGCGYAEFVNTGTGLITVSFDGTSSFAVASGASISSYLWDVDDGTITVGTTSTSAITATFPAGFRWVSLKVTDSNSKTHTARVPVFGANTSTFPPISQFEVLEDTLEQAGKRMNFIINSAIPDSTYPPGTLVMYWESEKYGTTSGSLAGPSGREHMKFIGWHSSASADPAATEQGIIAGTEFSCVGAAGRLAELPGFPQTVKRKSSPSKWSQAANLDIDRYLHYLLHWHSTALELADYSQSGLGTSYPLKTLQSEGQSLYDQVNQRANAIAHILTCDQRGRLFVKPDPLLLDAAGGETVAPRTTTSIVSLTDVDWVDDLQLEEAWFPRQHWLTGAAIVASADSLKAVQCIAPGNAPGQGVSADLSNYRLVSDQDELNAQTGHMYARNNTRFPNLIMRLANTGDAGIEPAFMEWVTATLDDALFERDWDFTNTRLLPLRLTIAHSNDETFTKEVEVEFQIETTGTPAQTVPVQEGGAGLSDFDLPSITLPVLTFPPITFPDPTTWMMLEGLQDMALFSADGYIYITNDFGTTSGSGGPTWTRKTMGVSGDFIMWTCDPWSPGYLHTGSAVNGWVLTTTGIYRLENIFSSLMTTTLQRSHAATIETGNIIAPWGQKNWVIANLHYRQTSPYGNWCAYTVDGVHWAEVAIEAYNIGVAGYEISAVYGSSRLPGVAYAAATSALDDKVYLYKTFNFGATWARQANYMCEESCSDCHVPWEDNASQLLVYYGRRNRTPIPIKNFLYKSDGTTQTDVSPANGYGPRVRQWGIYASPEDREVIVAVCSVEPSDEWRIFTTTDGGGSWTARDSLRADGSAYYAGAIGGDNSSVVYVWGDIGVAYSSDQGATFDDRKGNLYTTFTPGSFNAIAGGIG